MPKKDGYKTREKILKKAEKLFSEKGFNGTSVNAIATAVGINKGLIYYHFKDKKDIILSIFTRLLDESIQEKGTTTNWHDSADNPDALEAIKSEMEYFLSKKKIISMMLMESLKKDDKAEFLFKMAQMVTDTEINGNLKNDDTKGQLTTDQRHRIMMTEFFTGFIPVVAFVALNKKWCDYFECDSDKALEYFFEAFVKIHLATKH